MYTNFVTEYANSIAAACKEIRLIQVLKLQLINRNPIPKVSRTTAIPILQQFDIRHKSYFHNEQHCFNHPGPSLQLNRQHKKQFIPTRLNINLFCSHCVNIGLELFLFFPRFRRIWKEQNTKLTCLFSASSSFGERKLELSAVV